MLKISPKCEHIYSFLYFVIMNMQALRPIRKKEKKIVN